MRGLEWVEAPVIGKFNYLWLVWYSLLISRASTHIMITFDDFKKLEIRVGKVISVEKISDADKLLKFVFDLGDEQRQIIAGMAEFFPDLTVLIGKEMPILVNIEPRNFRGNTSHGMIIAADVDGHPVLLHPEKDIPAGSIVK